MIRRDVYAQSKYTGMLQATKDILREEGLPVLVICEFKTLIVNVSMLFDGDGVDVHITFYVEIG